MAGGVRASIHVLYVEMESTAVLNCFFSTLHYTEYNRDTQISSERRLMLDTPSKKPTSHGRSIRELSIRLMQRVLERIQFCEGR